MRTLCRKPTAAEVKKLTDIVTGRRPIPNGSRRWSLQLGQDPTFSATRRGCEAQGRPGQAAEQQQGSVAAEKQIKTWNSSRRRPQAFQATPPRWSTATSCGGCSTPPSSRSIIDRTCPRAMPGLAQRSPSGRTASARKTAWIARATPMGRHDHARRLILPDCCRRCRFRACPCALGPGNGPEGRARGDLQGPCPADPAQALPELPQPGQGQVRPGRVHLPDAMAGGASGEAVKPGSPDQSLLYPRDRRTRPSRTCRPRARSPTPTWR